MNSDHAPTAEEQLPEAEVIPEDSEVLTRWQKDYPNESSSYFACALRCRIRERQLLAALRENREKDTRIAELEKNIAKRKAAGETTTRLFMQLQARAEAAEAQLAEKGARISELEKANAKIPKMYVWGTGRQGFYATAQAYSVAEARELLLEETGTTDGSCPIRALAVEAVRNENPTIFYRSNAQFTLTDSAELEEMDAHAETLRKRAEEAEAQLRAVSDALEEKLERVDPGRYGKYRYVREKDFDAFNARIRAIVEGK